MSHHDTRTDGGAATLTAPTTIDPATARASANAPTETLPAATEPSTATGAADGSASAEAPTAAPADAAAAQTAAARTYVAGSGDEKPSYPAGQEDLPPARRRLWSTRAAAGFAAIALVLGATLGAGTALVADRIGGGTADIVEQGSLPAGPDGSLPGGMTQDGAGPGGAPEAGTQDGTGDSSGAAGDSTGTEGAAL